VPLAIGMDACPVPPAAFTMSLDALCGVPLSLVTALHAAGAKHTGPVYSSNAGQCLLQPPNAHVTYYDIGQALDLSALFAEVGDETL
jgi:hypothetical protein